MINTDRSFTLNMSTTLTKWTIMLNHIYLINIVHHLPFMATSGDLRYILRAISLTHPTFPTSYSLLMYKIFYHRHLYRQWNLRPTILDCSWWVLLQLARPLANNIVHFLWIMTVGGIITSSGLINSKNTCIKVDWYLLWGYGMWVTWTYVKAWKNI